jgi:hypothetical protein
VTGENLWQTHLRRNQHSLQQRKKKQQTQFQNKPPKKTDRFPARPRSGMKTLPPPAASAPLLRPVITACAIPIDMLDPFLPCGLFADYGFSSRYRPVPNGVQSCRLTCFHN